MDRDFGLIHVRLQTWFPLQIQVYVNGHEWLARKLDKNGIRYRKLENAFIWVDNFVKAQKLWTDFRSLFRLSLPGGPSIVAYRSCSCGR
jgi:hypothetical protein